MMVKDTENARLLIGHEADIRVRSNSGGTTLIAAAAAGLTETAKILIEKGEMKQTVGEPALSGVSLREPLLIGCPSTAGS